MTNTEALQIATPSERELVMTRVFDAPRNLVFDAMTKPADADLHSPRLIASIISCQEEPG